jgi:transglutaminase-like putative cysteine protease
MPRFRQRKPATSAAAYLAHSHLPWLGAAALTTTLPHIYSLPTWLSVSVALLFLYCAVQWRRGYRVTPAWIRVLLTLTACVGIAFQYGFNPGRDSGIAMLTILSGLKLMELKSRRDSVVLLMLCHFLLLTHYFYSQNLLTGFWLIFSVLMVTAALLHIHTDARLAMRPLLARAARLIMQALPLMLALYLLFPRVSGPLWGMPQDAHGARTGLGNSMSPGSISRLSRDDAIAFRVQFVGAAPPRHQLYWRGPVFDHYDGRAWRTLDVSMQTPALEKRGQALRYVMTLEAHQRNWLLPLEMSDEVIGLASRMSANGVLYNAQPILARTRVEMISYPDYRLEPLLSPARRTGNLQLPENHNPRTLALAASWRAETEDSRKLAARVLDYFRRENFSYTLEPPLSGANAIDDFLFNTRLGFCEHYAGAFVALMRAARVPARVVTGYLGGEVNPVDGFLVVRQSAAHAWAEIWVAGEGWLRVDPTSVIPEDRIAPDARAARQVAAPEFAGQAIDWLQQARYRWEALNNRWNQWVLGYTPERQREVLAALGLSEPNLRRILLTLVVVMGALVLLLALWIFYPRRAKPTDPALRVWQKALACLRKKGVATPDWETPLALAQRLRVACPALLPLARLVYAARYEGQAIRIAALRQALNACRKSMSRTPLEMKQHGTMNERQPGRGE